MSRNLFDDIFLARGLKGLLSPPDMDNAVPKPGGILGGFDYRKPFENAGMENALAETDRGFALPVTGAPMSTNDIWRAKALSAEFARKPLGPGFGEMPPYQESAAPFSGESQEREVSLDPEEVRASLREASSQLGQSPDMVQSKPIPQSYFDAPRSSMLERAGKYFEEADDAFWRATANSIIPSFNAGDHFAAGMGALTGVDGNRGDYDGNLKRQQSNSELAEIKSPVATLIGKGAGSFLGGGLLRKTPTIQGGIISTLKDRPLPPTLPRGIPLRTPLKPRGRFNDY
jgi:hypothetical protein